MGRYAGLAIDSGALIIGGCCGTSPEHLAEMRRTIDLHERGEIPSVEHIVAATGPLTNTPATAAGDEPVRQRTGRRRGSARLV
jgi:5-methyltetrahydrofolate--homocysteine methyltransferase